MQASRRDGEMQLRPCRGVQVTIRGMLRCEDVLRSDHQELQLESVRRVQRRWIVPSNPPSMHRLPDPLQRHGEAVREDPSGGDEAKDARVRLHREDRGGGAEAAHVFTSLSRALR